MKYDSHLLMKVMSVLSGITFVLAVFAVGLILYWLFFPANIVSYPHGTNFDIVNKTVKAGGTVKYQLNYCKYTNDISTVYVTLIGKGVYTLAPIQRNIGPGCQTRVISDVYIPPTVPPGTYSLHIAVEYRPNPIRTVIYYVTTNSFQVVN